MTEDIRVKEYGLSVEVSSALADRAFTDSMVACVMKARDEALELQALAVFDPPKYRKLVAQREAERKSALPWSARWGENMQALRERLALKIAPWLESDW